MDRSGVDRIMVDRRGMDKSGVGRIMVYRSRLDKITLGRSRLAAVHRDPTCLMLVPCPSFRHGLLWAYSSFHPALETFLQGVSR